MERQKSLEMAVSQIERQYGQGAIMRMGDAALRKVEVISTGALSLDLALGTGGVPRGRIVEIYGPEAGFSVWWVIVWAGRIPLCGLEV